MEREDNVGKEGGIGEERQKERKMRRDEVLVEKDRVLGFISMGQSIEKRKEIQILRGEQEIN